MPHIRWWTCRKGHNHLSPCSSPRSKDWTWALSPNLNFTFIRLWRCNWFSKELSHKGMFWRNCDLPMGGVFPCFPPSEALISRIINPDLCNPIGTLWSSHQSGPTQPEINELLIVQSHFHQLPLLWSIPWPKEENPSVVNWLILIMSSKYSPLAFTGHPSGDFKF